ncbi:fatty acid desaturase [Foetidibacter luteolus]|uniref:fatty acid desaturase n=1 Tax=Foetidibacter luteolus TaxID=2608880 RepID=UPI00129BF7F3|nr:fatty acid desaturase [Foetidibacter luteolus]
MSFIETVLDVPSYGWKNLNGSLSKPSASQLFAEFRKKLNVFANRKNWLSFFSWFCMLLLAPFLVMFITMQVQHFSIMYILIAFVYGMIMMGTHGTIWYHRYCTHHSYTFKNKFWRFITANLVLKLIPEEVYVISHHVHHALSDKPGDPYNARGGFLYCFLADVNHQQISKNLSGADYERTAKMLRHTGITANSYAAYKKWGTVSKPFTVIAGTLANWAFWLAVFYFAGGLYLALAVFAGAFVWGMGVRTFNYEGHGKGKNKQVEGTDFNNADMSVNQWWPGIVAGEWHNNHHLYPSSARSGFLPWQIDLAWYYIKALKWLGAVTSCRDAKQQFIKKYIRPSSQQP